MIQNQKGFALATCLALLPVLGAALIASYFVAGSMHLDLSSKQICRKNGIEAQKQVRPLLTLLMGLNPVAKALEAEYWMATFRVATCAGQPCLAPAVAHQQRVLQRRQNLDIRQKQIIQQANTILRLQHGRTKWQLQAHFLQNRFLLFRLNQTRVNGQAPQLAVRPVGAGPAPTYRTKELFTEKQALAYSWQYRLELTKIVNPLHAQGFKVQRTCAVSLKEEKNKWSVLTLEGKSLSKLF